MATVKHRFVNPKVDSGDATIARPSAWNDDHVLSDGNILAARRGLTANTTFYVATTGDDLTGDGSVSLPWKTIQHAIDYVYGSLDPTIYDVHIQLADGTYTGNNFLSGPYMGTQYGPLIKGNAATPENVVVVGSAGDAFFSDEDGEIRLANLEVRATGGSCLYAYGNGHIVIEDLSTVRFGTCTANHIKTTAGGRIDGPGSRLIVGGARCHIQCDLNGYADLESTTTTLSGTPNFTSSFINVSNGGIVNMVGNTITGAATGKKYSQTGLGFINALDVNGGSGRPRLDDVLPGNVAGTSGHILQTGEDYGVPLILYGTSDVGVTSGGPFLQLYHSHVAASTGDEQGIDFAANNNAGNKKSYGQLFGQIGNSTAGAESYRWYFDALIAGTNTTLLRLGPGLQLGAPTGGDKGLGTLNAAGDIYKNNGAYTNPDYALESYFHGSIERYKDNEGAAEYQGLVSLDNLHQRLESDLRLPGIHDEPMGAFERTDKLLEKLEEAFIYITQLHERIAKLESR